jgi:hypothetical protein
MSYIPNALRQQVVERARNRCEYCGLFQEGQEATFHVDHVLPVKHAGKTTFANLALACVSCSLHKAAKQTASDPETGKEAPLFNPRKSPWNLHFQWSDVELHAKNACGRATIAALKINRPLALAVRHEEKMLGRHPAK